ncbi:hypothetical protein BUALT_Bualt15G0070500 [Buddleja alternifolia]|uniref:CG-1 domain-containing protein n=1 Tax=Buddleja alternifolia TaxID=168488 RepID=A0AAV6WDV8_9LAMI|nr:hypothetical protein BUALT_Bualt15G0070500 [Buddleja alternifolia]
MAESGSCNLGFQLDVKQILLEAQHRWLRPAEICEILRNYQKFHISPEAPNKPVSGSVFLFDRKVLRYFRKDGHNWRKKKDGKTIKEAHEKLKVSVDWIRPMKINLVLILATNIILSGVVAVVELVGSVDMLHCYYAHGEDNEYFQRRSYWLLEQNLMHIVFVHYLVVKGNKTNMNSVRNTDTVISKSENDSSLSSSYRGTSQSSTLSSAYEDAESEDNLHASSRLHSYPESPLTDGSHFALSTSYYPPSSPGTQNASAPNYASLSRGHRDGDFGGVSSTSEAQTTTDLSYCLEGLGKSSTGEIAYKQESDYSLPIQANWQHSFQDSSSHLHSPTMNQNLILNLPRDHGSNLFEEKSLPPNEENYLEPFYALSKEEQSQQRNLQMLLSDAGTGNAMNQNSETFLSMLGNENYSFHKKPVISSLQTDGSLKKVDSFTRWITKELGDTDELNLESSNDTSWSIIGSEYDSNMPARLQVDTDPLSPSISQDQLFSIDDFSPNGTYSNLETKVLITGTFLKSDQELSKCRWSIMFGQVEVAAEVLADGILCCCAPLHKPGPVPFYVTCSNRVACSEIREFEYRIGPDQNIGATDIHGCRVTLMHLYQRFESILSVDPIRSPVGSGGFDFEKQNIVNKIVSLMEEDNNQEMNLTSVKDTTMMKGIGELLLEKQLKEKFYSWLTHRVTEDGKGPTTVDKGGQGVLHLAAALGFNWALQPIIVSKISIDFRDMNGWTALHWAAYYGREATVVALVSLGAAPGALTDPYAEYPLGRTPADLASSNGHKGISGFLAETSLTTHLSTLGVNDSQEDGISEVSGAKAIQTVSERLAVPTTEEDVPDALSLKDSLAAVCNATQAAARIHQIFRVQSFQRKKFIEQGCDELLSPDEHAVSFVAAKTSRLGHSDGMVNDAAVHIQKKFRGWKKRKEFLLIRQKIVRIQAHFRGHQVRRKYKPIIWSVGILEKVILRWRRKGSGLRGFKSDAVLKGPNTQATLPQEDDYDFLKEGRKQTEVRMQKALARVKSMAQYPEARAQYRRLLTAAEGSRETKDASDIIPDHMDDVYSGDDLIDVESLWDDDTFMSLTFQ